MAFVFAPEDPVTIPIAGADDRFAVRRVYCIGRRSRAASTSDLCAESDREPPFLFCKPADAVVTANYMEVLELKPAPLCAAYYYEAGLVVAIGRGGSDIEVEHALKHVWGYAVGLTVARYDVQRKMGEMIRELGEVLRYSMPVGPIHPTNVVGQVEEGRAWLVINDLTKQISDASCIIWSVAETAAYASQFFRLEPGDLIYTQRLQGVGATRAGDIIAVGIERLGELSVRVI